MENFKFYHITDLHLYANKKIGSHGKSYEFRCSTDQKSIEESEAIVEAAFEKMAADKDTDVIIISGDLTCDGEKESHDCLLKMLKKLKDAGKRVYLTFATHDFNNVAMAYIDNEIIPIEQYPREKLRELYNDYGWHEAISEHKESTSYSVRIFEGWRFLMLNDDGNGRSFCGFGEELLCWIKNQVREAEQKGERVVAVTHHPMLPPVEIYPLFSHRDMLGGYETTAPLFADLGIEYVFTGHTHMQSIRKIETARGNRLYHINTGSVCGYPAPFRKVEIKENGFDIKTENVEEFTYNGERTDAQAFLENHVATMVRDIFDSMENDIERFKEHAKGFSMDAKTVYSLKPAIEALGRFINSLNFKTFSKIFFFLTKADSSIESLKVRDFFIDVISDVFSGYRHYPPETPQYKAVMPVIEAVSKLYPLKDYYGNKVSLKKVFDDIFYETGELDNTNAFLEF